jgi:preprotein translocase subunit SecE
MAKFGGFFKECVGELKKVVWPSRDDVLGSVKIVIISTIVVAVVLGLFDLGFTELFRLLMK